MLVEDIERTAGIKLERVGIPQPEDVIRASAKDILSNLDEVNNDVLPLFSETAKALVDHYKGDSETALCAALAFISGYYKTTMVARSLLTGQERQLTMKLTATHGGRLNPQNVVQIIRRYWSPRLADSVRQMRAICDGSGAVFDIFEDQQDRFMENY